ncbi:peptidase family A16 [Ancylostoma caninum]|uniref:Peptidase family A16 n=1 Tax=Ancylostoma caninum TaxID=29170 RepID=A0A368GZD6_ANCCA|nr:peptidase family A16 [Ancylostoma caninum]
MRCARRSRTSTQRSAQNSSEPLDHPLPVHASDLPQEGCHVQPGNGSSHGFGLPSGPPHNSSLACPPGLTSFPPPGLSNGYSLGQNFNPPNATAYEQPLKLPAFELPEFNGEIDAFLQFWDLFATAVHNNTSVPVALKFMYLKTHLKGNAANLIANFQPTAQNYEDAVRVLLNTYNRPEILRSRLWDKLINQRASTDAPISQRTTLCAVQALWSQMKHVNEDASAIGTLKLIRSKFPKRTREKVGELKSKGDSMWTVDELLKALDKVIDQLEVIEDADPTPDSSCNVTSSVRQGSRSPCGSLSPASTSRRRAGSPHTRRVGFADQTQHPSRTNQSSTCVLSPHELTPSDEEQDCQDDDLHSPSARQHTSNSPSISCSAMYQPSLLTPIPRLMVVHAPTYNYKADADELLTVFLDSGSQYSFIRKSLALRLGIPLYCPQNITTLTFGGHEFTEESARVTLTLWDQHDEPVLIHLWTREVITTVPSVEDLGNPACNPTDGRVQVDVLIGRLTNITPIRYELSTNESYESITSCYEDLCRTLDQFWDLWHREYLTSLAEKNATRSSRRQAAKKLPQVGDVVLIRQENTARSMWPMGLVLELYRSKDGLSRSARLRMGTKNIVERSVNQLVPLEVTAVDADNLERRQTPPAPTRIQPPRAVKQLRSAACTP